MLRRLIAAKNVVRVLEVHSPLVAYIVEQAVVERDGQLQTFDAIWSDSLTSSIVYGKPDIESLDLSTRANGINEIFGVTTKPLIYDAGNYNSLDHFPFMVRTLERTGVSAIIIGNDSLIQSSHAKSSARLEEFCQNIQAGKRAQLTENLMVVVRLGGFLGNFLAESDIKNTMNFIHSVLQAGADGIMIPALDPPPPPYPDEQRKNFRVFTGIGSNQYRDIWNNGRWTYRNYRRRTGNGWCKYGNGIPQ